MIKQHSTDFTPLKNLDALMHRIKDIYIKHCKLPSDKIDDILSHDIYWDASTCLSYGLIDEIVGKTK